jgi:hypothetical protein
MASPNFKKRVIDLLSKGAGVTNTPGLPELGTDAALVASIFSNADYSSSELTELQAWFAANAIAVKGAHTRSIQDLPCVVVQRLQDGEQLPGNMGDHFGHDAAADTDTEVVFVRGFRASERFRIVVYAHKSTDMRDALYLAARELLLRGRNYLEDDDSGVEMMTFQSGQDDQEVWRDEAEPQLVYTATLFLNAQTKTTWRDTQSKATSCTGKSNFNQWQDSK